MKPKAIKAAIRKAINPKAAPNVPSKERKRYNRNTTSVALATLVRRYNAAWAGAHKGRQRVVALLAQARIKE